MALVDYSDSDASDVEEGSPVAKPTTNSSKPAFPKVVDRANPGKIRVSLPQASLEDNITSDEPPAKRAKVGEGAFSGFSSFLPAPKRSGQSSNSILSGGNGTKRGLGAGVNLKTGSTPGFSREVEPEEYATTEERPSGDTETGQTKDESELSLSSQNISHDEKLKPAHAVKLVGKPLMFKPLSVARKPAKKTQAPTAVSSAKPKPTTPTKPQTVEAAKRTKISLFSLSTEPSSSSALQEAGEYQPMIYKTSSGAEYEEASLDSLDPSNEQYTSTSHAPPPLVVPTPPVSQSLDDIAGDLNLSAAERRQLFGRQKGPHNGTTSATKVINFNTDDEYVHNEELRAQGETIKHNPVRSIAPGKHSLKQLVNAAQSQKEALEESFAQGRNNRAEASSRYGW